MKINTIIKNNEYVIKILLVGSLILLAIIFRLLPHPPNFTPIAALAIFGGAILPKKWALFLPLTAMIVSDLIIGMHSLIWVTWGSFLIIALASNRIINKIRPLTITGASLSASLFFFVATNLGVWLEGRLYPLNVSGLINCYYNAIPFFRNTLLGDLAYSTILFGAYFLVYRYAIKGKGSLKLSVASSKVI
jgi:hypothetical protein